MTYEILILAITSAAALAVLYTSLFVGSPLSRFDPFQLVGKFVKSQMMAMTQRQRIACRIVVFSLLILFVAFSVLADLRFVGSFIGEGEPLYWPPAVAIVLAGAAISGRLGTMLGLSLRQLLM